MNKFSLVIAALIASTAAKVAPRLDGRVIGGQIVDIEQFPYQVSLQHYGSHICGATVIGERFILTAAHCTAGAIDSDLSVRLGSSYHASGGIVVQVKKINDHPEFDNETMVNDISVLELAESITLSPSIQAVPLTDMSELPQVGNNVVISGWGRTSEGNPEQLQAVWLNVVDHQQCVDAYVNINEVTTKMFCAAAPKKDACQGDSGGPLVGDGKLIGVISWGYGCAMPNYPGVYTSVAHMRDFVQQFTSV